MPQPVLLAFLDREVVFVPALFAFVEPADDAQDQVDGLGMFGVGFKKLAAVMRPAADPGDVGMRLGVRFVGAIAIGLKDAGVSIDQRREFAVAPGQAPVEDDVVFWPADHPQPAFGGAAAFFIGVVTSDRSFIGLQVYGRRHQVAPRRAERQRIQPGLGGT